MSLLLIAAALGVYSEWEATFKPRPSLVPVCAPAVAGLHREAAVRSTFMLACWLPSNQRFVKREKRFVFKSTKHVLQGQPCEPAAARCPADFFNHGRRRVNAEYAHATKGVG